jgi:HAMP domain-containing protein
MPDPRPAPPEESAWADQFDPRYSLRAQAALILGGLALLLTLAFTAVATKHLETRIEESVGPMFENLASEIREKIDRGMYERYHELQLTASMPTFRETTLPAAARQAAINLLNDSAEEYAWIGFADMTGNLVLASHGVRAGEAVGEETWFRSGVRGASYVGDVREAPELEGRISNAEAHLRVFEIAVPVTDINGKMLGVLCASLRWSWVQQVQDSVVPEAYRRQKQNVSIYSAKGDLLFDAGVSGWSRPPEYPPVPAAGEKRFKGYMYETSEGAVFFSGYALSRGFRGFRGLGWMITLRQPVTKTFADVDVLRTNILLVGCSLSALIMAMGWFLASRLTRRLRAIETAANYIRGGDVLTLIPNPPGEGELARMCRALGRMVQTLREKAEPAHGGHGKHPNPGEKKH